MKKFLSTIKNSFLLSLCYFFKIVHPKKNLFDKNAPKILLVSTTALGDTLWATPIIKDIKQTFPKSFLCVLTSKIGFTILQNNPDIDALYVFQKPLFKLFRLLWKKKFQVILHLHSSQRLILPFCHLLGAEKIIGHAKKNKGLDALITTAIDRKNIHEIDRRKEIALQIGVKDRQKRLLFYLSKEEKQQKFPFLDKGKTIIAIHPGAKDSYKRWPIKYFAALCHLLQKKLDTQFIITGNSLEKSIAEELSKKIKGSLCVAGEFSLRQMASFLTNVDYLITNDTGPMHLAFSLKTKCVAIFAPTDPKICGPYFANNDALVLSSKKTCSPCVARKCSDPFCLLQISPRSVYDAIIRKWKKDDSSKNSDCDRKLERQK